jgi:hypothetical protein
LDWGGGGDVWQKAFLFDNRETVATQFVIGRAIRGIQQDEIGKSFKLAQ